MLVSHWCIFGFSAMAKILLISVGKIKHSWMREGITDYAARLKHYADFKMLQIKDSNPKKEGAEMLVRAEGMLVALTPVGRTLSSEQFADFLKKQNRPMTFFIGNEEGLSPDVLAKADFQLSLSPMTLPHDLCKLVFLEQLYRAFTILKGEKYHR